MGVNIYIAEDHPEQAQQLVQAVKNYALFSSMEMRIAGVHAAGKDLLASCDRKNRWNIYFLDINLEEDDEVENGFALAQKIRSFDPLGFIIFITVRSEFSFLTFLYRIQALDYILKDSAINIQERVHSCLRTVEERLIMLSDEQTISLSTGEEVQSFINSDILYIAAHKSNFFSLYTKDSEYPIYQETLNGLEEKLGSDFVRCHRGFLVNKTAIYQASKDFKQLILNDQTILPISTRQKNKVKKVMQLQFEDKIERILG